MDGSSISVIDDINIAATTDDRVELNLFNSSNLFLGNSIVRGTPAYGNITNDGSSSIHYTSANNLQSIAASAGSGTGDEIDYINLIVNNTRLASPMLSLEGDVIISGTLTLNRWNSECNFNFKVSYTGRRYIEYRIRKFICRRPNSKGRKC